MSTDAAIRDFLSRKELAIAGVSRDGRKFGNAVYPELTAHGYTLRMVHPEAESLEGTACFADFAALPDSVEGAILILPRERIEGTVREAHAAGIRRLWIHQRLNSPDVSRFCDQQGISLIQGQCILMFAEPVATFHRIHRWIWRILGKLPREERGEPATRP